MSSTELLKLPFFKKAKSKEFIKEVVLGDAPNLQSRAKKVKKLLYVCMFIFSLLSRLTGDRISAFIEKGHVFGVKQEQSKYKWAIYTFNSCRLKYRSTQGLVKCPEGLLTEKNPSD